MNNFSDVIARFTAMLDKNNIDYVYKDFFDGGQWKFPKHEGGDIAIHFGTYGADMGFLESYCMPWDEGDVTACTPEEMINRLLGNEPKLENEYEYSADDLYNSFKALYNVITEGE